MSITQAAESASPYPIVVDVELEPVAELVARSFELEWDPLQDIPWDTLEELELPREVREAGALFWSVRSWMEHGAIPYGAERLRQAIFEHRPYEVKQHLINFIREESRHFQASYLIAEKLAGFQPAPRDDYFQAIIPRFHDEKMEVELAFYPNLFLNTLFEALSGELLQDRYHNATNPAIKEACRLILRDETRHIRFGKILMEHKLGDLTDRERRAMEEKFEFKLRQSLLRGVYAVTNLPDDMQKAAGEARRIAAEWGLGATSPDREQTIIAGALGRLREELAPLGVALPHFPEIGDRPEA